jgi:predicted SAM-dependent methyltransferase
MRSAIRQAVPGSDAVYEEFRLKWLARNSKKRAADLVNAGQPLRLDIGGGDLKRDGWITIDIAAGCDLFWDLRRGIPFPDSSVDFIYSSHFLEHLSYNDGQAILQEALRVLKPGAEISVCVPDARMYIDAYLGQRELDPDREYWQPAFVSDSGIDLLNYVAYMGGEHACLFDQEGLVTRLLRAGFVDVQARAFDPSIDLVEREFESIYAHARKP